MANTLILGSASSRRCDLLKQLGLSFEQIASGYDEESFQWPQSVEKGVQLLAIAKANTLACRFPNRAILTADTMVICNNRLLGKPKDRAQAKEFLTLLSRHEHEVFTGVCVSLGKNQWAGTERTLVKIRALSHEQIEQYIQTPLPYDKAGGYAIQQAQGGLLVESIRGCYYNVVGLPLNLVANLLQHVGINLWSIAFAPHS